MKQLIITGLLLICNTTHAGTTPFAVRIPTPFPVEIENGVEVARCPTGYAFEIPRGKGYDFEGHYLRCDDYDMFYKLLDEGRTEEAKKFLLMLFK